MLTHKPKQENSTCPLKVDPHGLVKPKCFLVRAEEKHGLQKQDCNLANSVSQQI